MSIALTALLQRTCSGISTRIGARLQVTRKAPLRRTFAVSSTITTVALEHEEEETVKKSRFVARCAPAVTFSSAKEFIDRVSDPKARHNCWAWCGEKSQRSNDDGEPSGTAGRPILNSIEGEGLLNVVVVVTRYKSKDAPMLGAGGLLRAYGSAASLVLRAAARVEEFPVVSIELMFPMSELGSVQSLVARYEGRKEGSGTLVRNGEDYSKGTSVTLTAVVEEAFAAGFEAELTEATNGAATMSLVLV